MLALLVLGGIIVSGWSLLPSHIEYRYLIPYYWPFALFADYAYNALVQWLSARRHHRQAVKKIRPI